MSSQTLFYIVLAGVAALLLALFQYWYKQKQNSRLKFILTFLRFLSWFSVLLLFINPKFDSVSYYEEKPNLIVALDNSESVKYLKQDERALQFYNSIISHEDLKKRFNITSYTFGNDLKISDTVAFNETRSNLSKALTEYYEIYKNSISPLVVITDGNQTYGSDYQYNSSKFQQQLYPVILGDTITFSDLKIQQLNVNRYAYLKNRFPVEVILNYSGSETIRSQFKIWKGNSVIFSKNIEFSSSKTSAIINTNLLASKTGVNSYTAEIVPIESEKNKINNVKNFAVEVIDQKTNIAIVSEILHPDIGALKKSIESNERRKVSILKPSDYILKMNDFQLVIIYNPNNNFSKVLSEVSRLKLNTFIIGGKTTDWNTVNKGQSFFTQEITNQLEEYQPSHNINYNTFIVENLKFESYPPLVSEFGEIEFKIPNQNLLLKSINGRVINQPLLSTFEIDNQKHAILLGEGLWRWRAQSYLNVNGFSDFDNFIGKLIQYLSSNKKRNRLNVDYKSFYNGNDNLILTAQFFNKNYEFDSDANLEITLKNIENDTYQTYPLLLTTNSFSIDLSGISPGDYNFNLKSTNEPISVSGSFKVLEYNVEQQFLNADVAKLRRLALDSKGKSYFINNTETIIDDLINDARYKTIQKQSKSSVPLIDWKYLLGLIALSLSLEWFIRKYNGLI